jgi:hypothetical protein
VAIAIISPKQNATTPASSSSADTNTPTAATYDAHVAPPPALPTSPWTYSDNTDPMTSKVTKFACTTSTNEVQLTFPYHNVTAQLCIRKSARRGLDAYVQLNGDGQMLCDIEGCSLPIRFDSLPARRFPALESSDHSSNILFITRTASLVASLKKSTKATIEISFYQAGSQALEFPTDHLDWK